MPANPVKRYTVVRMDGTHDTYDFKRTDYIALEKAILDGNRAVKVSFGVLRCDHISEVIEAPEVKIQKDDKPAVPVDMMTAEEREYVDGLLREFYVHGVVNPFEEVD